MLFVYLLVACGDPCYDACNVLYGQGEDVCGGPDAYTYDNGVALEERPCRQVCRSSEEAEDRDLDEYREEWEDCVNGYRRDVASGSGKYGEPDADACLEARSECGWMPCENVTADVDGSVCLTGTPYDS